MIAGPWLKAGIISLGIFLFFGAFVAALAGATLIWQGSALDGIWELNVAAHKQLAPHGSIVGILFMSLSAALAFAGAGWFKRRLWGWRLAVGIIAVQALGDLANAIRGDYLRGGAGLIIAAAFLAFLLRPGVRSNFARHRAPVVQ